MRVLKLLITYLALGLCASVVVAWSLAAWMGSDRLSDPIPAPASEWPTPYPLPTGITGPDVSYERTGPAAVLQLYFQGPPPDRMVHAYMLSVQYWLKYCELADRRETKAAVLTPQEVECLRWCKEGKTNWEIGEILSISEKTAEFHLGNAMRKLGATNRITAVMIAIRRGIIHL